MATTAETLGSCEKTQARLTKSLAFFLNKVVDETSEGYRKDAVNCAQTLNSDLDIGLKEIYKKGLTVALQRMNDTLLIGTKLGLYIASSTIDYSRAQSILDDYSIGRLDEGEVVCIPTKNITAHHVLGFPSTADKFSPVLDIRVQTSQDKSVQMYLGSGQIGNIPNLGSWHRFPLGMIEVATIL